MGSLRYQFISSLDNSFNPNLNKHSYKKGNCDKQKIASYRYRRNLYNFSNNLVNYLRDNFNDVRNIKDIQDYHIYAFFKEKEECCSYRTLIQYRSYINVLDRCIMQNLHFKANLYKGVPEIKKPVGKSEQDLKVRNLYMKQEHINAILEYKKNSKSPALMGLRVSNLFGLRASEIVNIRPRDFDLEDGTFKVIGKGGKTRVLKLETQEQYDLATEILDKYNNDEKLVPLRPDSYNKFIKDSLHNLGIYEYDKAKTGNHAIRKKVAIENIKKDMANGIAEKEAYERESKRLGHNRVSVVKSSYANAE